MIFKGMYVSCGRWRWERVGTKQAGRRCDGGGGGGGDGGAEMKPPGGGGVKYGFTSPPGPRLFLRGCSSSPRVYVQSTYSHVYVCTLLGSCDVTRTAITPIMRARRSGGERGGWQDSFVRSGLEIQGGVLLLFSLHCHTRRQCFVSPIHGGNKLQSSRGKMKPATLKSEF